MSTVLIVGAGASTELCIPCSKELLSEVTSRLCTSLNYNEQGVFTKGNNGNYPWGKYRIDLVNSLLEHYSKWTNKKDYYQTGVKEATFINAINSFKEDLEKYIHNNAGSSIDAFLACHKNRYYHEIGRFILAYHFIGYEAHSSRESGYCKENWLRIFIESHLRHKLQSKQKDIGLKIITFNYERLVEHHVFNFLTNNMNLSQKEAERIITQELEIVHVYGKIADLPWQTNPENPMEFGARNDDEKFLQWAKERIKLIGWRINEETKKMIRRIIDNGDKFFLMGFGFDKDNMSILKLPSNKPIISTAYGIDGKTRSEIKKSYKLPKIKFMPKKMTCAKFVRSTDFCL